MPSQKIKIVKDWWDETTKLMHAVPATLTTEHPLSRYGRPILLVADCEYTAADAPHDLEIIGTGALVEAYLEDVKRMRHIQSYESD